MTARTPVRTGAVAAALSAACWVAPPTAAHAADEPVPQAPKVRKIRFPALREVGTSAAGQSVRLGGFSGLWYEGKDAASGRLRFVTHTDRGPNADSVDLDGDGEKDRPFVLPGFQPRLVRFEADLAAGTVVVTGETPLFGRDSVSQVTGVWNASGKAGMAWSDEPSVDLRGSKLPTDPLGLDLEGIARGADGSWWLCDEYRPSLCRFSSEGRLLERHVPAGGDAALGTPSLPAVYAQRRNNRGFEGVAVLGGRVVAFTQSALDNPDGPKDKTSKESRVVRVLSFDPAAGKTAAEFAYVLEPDGSDKIGDVCADGAGGLLVLERDDEVGPKAKKRIFRVRLDRATDISKLSADALGGRTPEQAKPEDLAAAGIAPVTKELVADLAALGCTDADKPEGLALCDGGVIALVNDDDFGLDGTVDATTGKVGFRADAPVWLVLIDTR